MIRFRTLTARAVSFSFLLLALSASHAASGAAVAGTHSLARDAGGESEPVSSLEKSRPIAPGAGIRVATYNIHSGLGSALSLWQSRSVVERNLREIAGDIAGPAGNVVDVVALNEVDFGSRRSAWIDEAAFLADELKARTGEAYDIVRGQTWQRDFPGREVRFGNALLVRLPILSASECLLSDSSCGGASRNDTLPSLRPSGLAGLLSEERGVIKVTVLAGANPVDVITTHLDAFSQDLREGQAMHLLQRFVDPERTTVLLGDLNAVATSFAGKRGVFETERTLDILTSGSLADARAVCASAGASDSRAGCATYPAKAPVWPLDAVLASTDLHAEDVVVIGADASDHRGLAALLVPSLDDESAQQAGLESSNPTLRTRRAPS